MNAPPPPMPTLGRIVHYVLGRKEGGMPVVRPAIVVGINLERQTVDLQVFTNGHYDDEVLAKDEQSSRDDRGRARSIVHRDKVPSATIEDGGYIRLDTDCWFWPPGAPGAPR